MTRWNVLNRLGLKLPLHTCKCNLSRAVCVRNSHFSSQAQTQAPKSSDTDWKDLTPAHLRENAQDFANNANDSYLPHKLDPTYNSKRTGSIISVENDIITVEGGLPKCKLNSLVTFENGAQGLVLSIENENEFKIGFINDLKHRQTPIVGTKVNYFENANLQPPKVKVGPCMIGKIVDPMCNEIDFIEKMKSKTQNRTKNTSKNKENLSEKNTQEYPEFLVNMFSNNKFIPHWMSYSRKRERILTGIKSIDTFYPLATGWRAAIVGNKNLRRSDIAIDILLSFKQTNANLHLQDRMYGIYVMIGKSEQEIIDLYQTLDQCGALEYSTIVASLSDDTLTKQYLTPYTGAAMADFFKYYGMNSLIIYDDFSVHNQVTSTLFRESLNMINYGNWSAELLERACQLSPKYGNGSHTALVLADKIDVSKDNGETFYYYLPYLQSHVDTMIELSQESFNRQLIPPISLLPVPYGSPKFHKGFLFELSNTARKKLFEMEELEKTYRQQMELGLDLEPDLEKISSNVFKMEVMFNQRYETSFAQLLLCLSCIANGVCENVHLDWIFDFEATLLAYFESPNSFIKNDSDENKNKIKCIENVWNELNELKEYDSASETLKKNIALCLSYFENDNRKFFQPKPLK